MVAETSVNEFDVRCMQLALEQAELAQRAGEVPIGAVVALDGEVIAVAGNRSISWHDPTAHAEIVALREAGRQMGSYRLPGATMYVTLEPCPMCLSAMVHARFKQIFFGASDPKTGALGGVSDLSTIPQYLRKIDYQGGLLKDACADILTRFFKEKRSAKR